MFIVGIAKKKIKNSLNNFNLGVDKTPKVCYNKYIKERKESSKCLKTYSNEKIQQFPHQF